MTDLPEITEARVLRLQPGDLLAIIPGWPLNDQDAEDISQRVREITGPGIPILILPAPGWDLTVVRPSVENGLLVGPVEPT